MTKHFITQSDFTSTETRNISSAHTETSGGSKEVEDRYYTTKEYQNLNKDQKLSLKRKREARGHKPAKRAKTGNDVQKQMGKLQRQQKKLSRNISALLTAQQSDDDDSSCGDSTSSEDTVPNRKKKALVRPKRTKDKTSKK